MSAGTVTSRRLVVVARWAARLWAAALVLFWGAFFVEHLAWFADPQRLPRSLVWVDRKGHEAPVRSPLARSFTIRASAWFSCSRMRRM